VASVEPEHTGLIRRRLEHRGAAHLRGVSVRRERRTLEITSAAARDPRP
jgi:hypothetical protein